MNYQNAKIYRIDCLTTNEVYIGSTCQTLAQRLSQHKSKFKRWNEKKTKDYTSSFPIIERDNYQLTLIELFPCNSKDELSSREGYFIRTMDCVNKQTAGRTPTIYANEHKEYYKEYQKEWYAENKKYVLEKSKERYQKNKDIINARTCELRQ